MAEKYKIVDGKIIKVVEEDVTEQLKAKLERFNHTYNALAPKVARREQLLNAIAAYKVEADKLDAEINTEINAILDGLDKDIIKQIEPEKAAKLGF